MHRTIDISMVLLTMCILVHRGLWAIDEIKLTTGEIAIPPRGLHRCVFTPEESPKCYLTIDARLENRTKSKGGSHWALAIQLDDRWIESDRLVNYHNPTYFATAGGNVLYIYSRLHHMYRTTYSGAFSPFSRKHTLGNHVLSPEYPYTYVFDITDIVKNSQTHTLSVFNKVRNRDYPLVIKELKVLYSYTSVRKDQSSDGTRITPTLPGVTVPRTHFAVPYDLTAIDGGRIELTINDEIYDIASAFSYPEGRWNTFASDKHGTGEWGVAVIAHAHNRSILKGVGKYYEITREILTHDECITVRDTITNSTADYLGVIVKHYVRVTRKMSEPYVCGSQISANSIELVGKVQSRESIRNTENPTVYVSQQTSGVGLFMSDDACRANVSFEATREEYAMMNRRLALAPRGSYSCEFVIYPTEKPDYFEFVNAARRYLGVNFTIDGHRTYARASYAKYNTADSEEAFTPFYRWSRPRYIGLYSHRTTLRDGKRSVTRTLADSLHGPACMTEKGKHTRKSILKARDTFRRINPDQQFIIYYNMFLSAEPTAAEKYHDSLCKRSDGSLVTYGSCNIPRIIPDTKNTAGREHWRFVSWCLEHDLGIHWDEWTMTDNVYSYTTGWDGYTGVIDEATFRLERRIQNIALASLAFRLRVLDTFIDRGLPVWCNFMPATGSATKRHFYCSVEGHSPRSGVRTHFYTPISLGASHIEIKEKDIADVMKLKLECGALYIYYAKYYTSDNNFMQDLYPFTPKELHAGYIIGEAKILTMYSGRFGWGDKSRMRVKVYDETGHLIDKTVSIVEDTRFGTLADVELTDGQFALIIRGR